MSNDSKTIKRVLSGMQPTGPLHLGRYLGAARQYIQLQEQGHECFYFIANYHALTSIRDKAKLEAITMHLAMGYLARSAIATPASRELRSRARRIRLVPE